MIQVYKVSVGRSVDRILLTIDSFFFFDRVYVRNIPHQYRTNAELTRFFKNCFSDDAVHESRIKAKLPDVTKLLKIRAQTQENLEYAVSANDATGERPKHKVKSKDKGKFEVDSIEGEL